MVSIQRITSIAAASAAFAVLTCTAGFAQGHMGPMGGERHPELRMARRHLEQARDALQHAAHDFKGHRQKAIDRINDALREIDEAAASDRH